MVFCFFSASFSPSFCPEITHNAQPNKLTDFGSRRYQVISWRLGGNACDDVPVLDSAPFLPSPSACSFVCHICFSSSTHIATAFRCYKGIYNAFYSIYAVLKCQMLPYFCFFGRSVHFPSRKPFFHFWFPLNHCTGIKRMHTNRKRPKKKDALKLNLWSRLIQFSDMKPL